MKHKIIKTTILCILILIKISVAVFAYEDIKLKSIEINGVSVVKMTRIKNRMRTQFPSVISSRIPFIRSPVFNESLFRRDIEDIKNLYMEEGYYDIDINYNVEIKNGKAYVSVSVKEGEPYKIENVKLNIQGDMKVSKKIEDLILFEEGDIFRSDLYEQSRRKMEEYLKNNGFFSAIVDERALVYREDKKVNVFFNVNTGPRQYFGEITVDGNEYVSDRYILREVTFKEGDLFSLREVQKSGSNIRRLGLFREVNIEKTDNDDKDVNVKVRVREIDKRRIGLGGGYGTEIGIRASLDFNRYYFMNMPRTLTLSGKYSEIFKSASLIVSQDYFWDRNSNIAVGVSYEQEDASIYTNRKTGASLRVGRVFGDKTDMFISYNYERNQPIHDEMNEEQKERFYTLSVIGAGLNYGYSPGAGWGNSLSLFMEPSSQMLGSDLDYVKAVGESRVNYRLTESVMFSSRMKIGLIEPFGETREIPVFKRFFAGGSNSIRGYGYQQVGPTDKKGYPVGGDCVSELNVEMRVSLFGPLQKVVFFDTGNVYKNRRDFDFSDLYYSTGSGFRYNTPVGPLGIDVAFPIEENKLLWGKYRVHFSLGHVY